MTSSPSAAPDSTDPAHGTAVHLLGGFRLVHRGRTVPVSAAAQRLVAVLALQGPLSRSAAAGRLWPRATEARAQGNLRSTLWRLRREVDVIDAGAHVVGLATWVGVDVDELAARLRSLTATGPVAPQVAGWTPEVRDLLPDWDDDWVVLERERLRQGQIHALEELALLRAREERYRDALDVALRAVRLEPLRESAHRVVVRIHLEEGNAVEAVRHFCAYRELVRRELGVEPTPRLCSLISDVCPAAVMTPR